MKCPGYKPNHKFGGKTGFDHTETGSCWYCGKLKADHQPARGLRGNKTGGGMQMQIERRDRADAEASWKPYDGPWPVLERLANCNGTTVETIERALADGYIVTTSFADYRKAK